MQKRIFTLSLVVVIAILVGVTIVKKQAREPILRELLKRQSVMLEAQKRLEEKLDLGEALVGAPGAAQNSALLKKVTGLENRLAALEAKLKTVEAAANRPKAPRQEDPAKVHDITVGHSPVRGNKDASVTIVEFVDFQCPFCARFHAPIMATLKAYPKDVNYVLKNFPLGFHAQAKPAAKAAFAAGEQGKYWEMADALLENGKVLSEEKIKEIAGTIGLNVKKFLDDYKNKDAQWDKQIQSDMALAQKVGVRGTPTFYINGRKTNARDINSLKAEIDKILSEK